MQFHRHIQRPAGSRARTGNSAGRDRRPGRRPHARALLAFLPIVLAVLQPAGALESLRIADGLAYPIFVTAPPGDARLFILEQRGVIKLWRDDQVLPTPFLDIEALVTDIGGFSEQGLLGLAFHPEFASNGHFFVNYTDNAGNTVVARYTVSGDPDLADPQSAVEILTISQPQSNHNGGMIAFGADGYLYIGTGDGGGAGDPGNRAQNLATLLGKMLRIDIDAGPPYGIPPDNPFVAEPEARPEIWAYGLRNPWRWSFDRDTGDLWLGDVGQTEWEEIDYQAAASPGGENYGWRLMEGFHCYNPPVDCDDGTLTYPIHEYDHNDGRCSVTGGYVYRGAAVPELVGHYFFADFCSRQIWSLRYEGGSVVDLQERTDDLAPGGGLSIDWISSFGEDGFGELYIVDRGTGDNGEIYKILPSATSVEEDRASAAGLRWQRLAPNPFGSRMRLQLALDEAGHLEVHVIDSGGRVLHELARGRYDAGSHDFEWDGRDLDGRPVEAGVYYVTARLGAQRVARSVQLLR